MKKLSSGQTFYFKRILPVFWVLFLAAFIVIPLIQGNPPEDGWVPLLAFSSFFVVIGFLVYRQFIADLADEVLDNGSQLLVRRSGVEDRIDFSNIMNVSMSSFSNPQRLSLRLRKGGKLGDEVVFIPKLRFTFNPVARHPIVEDLIKRSDAARSR